jgi:hypothetical protein
MASDKDSKRKFVYAVFRHDNDGCVDLRMIFSSDDKAKKYIAGIPDKVLEQLDITRAAYRISIREIN